MFRRAIYAGMAGVLSIYLLPGPAQATGTDQGRDDRREGDRPHLRAVA
jgi:hypothetical protein